MLVWQTLWTIAVAVVTSVVTVWAKDVLFGPKLRLVFRHDEYGTVATTETLYPEETAVLRPMGSATPVVQRFAPEVRAEVVYVRLRVQNTGRGIAKNCRGYLTDVERRGDDGRFIRTFFDSIPLCWSYLPADAPQTIDLPTGVDANLDLVSSHHREAGDVLRPRTVTMPHCYEDLFRARGGLLPKS